MQKWSAEEESNLPPGGPPVLFITISISKVEIAKIGLIYFQALQV